MVLLVPVQGFIMKIFSTTRASTVKYSDERIKNINEIMQGIRIIKFFSWEESFKKKVSSIRLNEIREYIKVQLLYCFNTLFRWVL